MKPVAHGDEVGHGVARIVPPRPGRQSAAILAMFGDRPRERVLARARCAQEPPCPASGASTEADSRPRVFDNTIKHVYSRPRLVPLLLEHTTISRVCGSGWVRASVVDRAEASGTIEKGTPFFELEEPNASSLTARGRGDRAGDDSLSPGSRPAAPLAPRSARRRGSRRGSATSPACRCSASPSASSMCGPSIAAPAVGEHRALREARRGCRASSARSRCWRRETAR